jgi:hypothetical protein
VEKSSQQLGQFSKKTQKFAQSGHPAINTQGAAI